VTGQRKAPETWGAGRFFEKCDHESFRHRISISLNNYDYSYSLKYRNLGYLMTGRFLLENSDASDRDNADNAGEADTVIGIG
jgi:hypothetical protein